MVNPNPAERRLTEARPALEDFLRTSSGARAAQIVEAMPLTGGAIQKTWRLEIDFDGGVLPGRQDLVLRSDVPTQVAATRSRPQEFAVLRAVWRAGVTVPEPLWLCSDTQVL